MEDIRVYIIFGELLVFEKEVVLGSVVVYLMLKLGMILEKN